MNEKLINLEDKLNKNLLEIINNILLILKYGAHNNKPSDKDLNNQQINKENKNKKYHLMKKIKVYLILKKMNQKIILLILMMII